LFGNGMEGSCVKSGTLGRLRVFGPLCKGRWHAASVLPAVRPFETEKERGKVPSKLPAFLAALRSIAIEAVGANTGYRAV
jgi:hypothetical protein